MSTSLEAAELDDVQPHLLHALHVVEQDGHLAMALDARDGVDGHASQTLRDSGAGGGFKGSGHGFLNG